MPQYTGTIEKMVFGGDGFLKNEEGIAVFLPGGITHQKVLYHVSKKKKNFWQGDIISVIEPSAWEILEAERKNKLPGCPYQNIRYQHQIEAKTAQLEEIFREFSAQILPTLSSGEETGYRNKMEFSFGFSAMTSEKTPEGKKIWKDEGFALGFHPPKNWASVVSIPDVFITSDAINIIRKEVENTIPLLYPTQLPWNALTRKGFFRGLILRESRYQNSIQVNLVVSEAKPNSFYDPFLTLLQSIALPNGIKISGVIITVHQGQSDAIVNPEYSCIWGEESFEESLLGRIFRVSPFSFFQTNTKGAEVLYSTIQNALGDVEGKTVLDLFCGTGSIGIFCAAQAKEVIGIEMVEEAVIMARHNAKRNGIENAHFFAGKAEKILSEVLEKHPPESVIIDPPRAGMHPDALSMIAELPVSKLVYVSCNPATLARDAAFLEQNGWKLTTLQGVDMFPHTPHLEVVAQIVRP